MESGESGELPLKFGGFAKFVRPTSELNSSRISENSPLRRSSKMTLGTSVMNKLLSTDQGSDLDAEVLDGQGVFKKKDGKVFGGNLEGYGLAQREADLKIMQYGLDKKEAELKERERAIGLILNSFRDREGVVEH